MKNEANYGKTLVLGTSTAIIALLSGLSVAAAQGTPPPAAPPPPPPAASAPPSGPNAPGSGSFPGSFLVPGTNTSIGFHGFMRLDVYDDVSAGQIPSSTIVLAPLDAGSGIAAGANHQLHGKLDFNVRGSRANFETRTPSGYGELKTFVEVDFVSSLITTGVGATVQPGGAQSTGEAPCCSNSETPRLRQAYGTMGPVLFGQTFSLFSDVDSYAEEVDGGQDSGFMTVFSARLPQFRYTYLAGNGIAIAASLEQPITQYTFGSQNGTTTPPTQANSQAPFSSSLQRLPALVGAARIDQNWGHAMFKAMVQQLRIENGENVPIAGAGGTGGVGANPGLTTGNHLQRGGYAFSFSGHLNTFGKDRAVGGIQYGRGAGNYQWETAQGSEGLVWNTTNNTIGRPYSYGIYGGYQHWWTDTLRTNIAGGWAYVSRPGNTGGWNGAGGTIGTAALSTLQKHDYSTHVNLYWSPVPQTDFAVEWAHGVTYRWNGSSGAFNRLEGQFTLKF